jgi:GxxExxY protein
MLSRVPSALPVETDEIIRRIIGCAIEVHRELGAGYLETIYHRAMVIELGEQGLSSRAQQPVHVNYKGRPIHGQRIDLIIEGRVVVEIKAVARLDPIHRSQVVSYLRATSLRAGLLINFNTRWLRDGIKRVVL